MPVMNVGVIVCESSFIKLNGYALFLARLKEYLFEAFELFLGAENSAFAVGNIDLSDFSARNIADIFNFEADLDSVSVFYVLFADSCAGIFKFCVGKTVAKRELNILAGGVVVSVSDINAFSVFDRLC